MDLTLNCFQDNENVETRERASLLELHSPLLLLLSARQAVLPALLRAALQKDKIAFHKLFMVTEGVEGTPRAIDKRRNPEPVTCQVYKLEVYKQL